MFQTSYFYQALCVLVQISFGIEAYRPQEIILFSEVNFTGKQKSFYQSSSDLQSDPVGKIAKSHCVVRGLWRISGAFDSKKPVVKFMENAYGDEKNGNVCGSWNTPNQTAQYRSIHLIGSDDLDTPAINLNMKSRFFGEEELYFDGKFLRLPKPINFTSYGFTGRANWTIYKSTNFSGSSDCLIANVDVVGDAGVTFNINKSLTVGSISRGCGTEKDALLSRKLPEPKTKNKPGKESSGFYNSYNEFLISIIALLSPIMFLLQ